MSKSKNNSVLSTPSVTRRHILQAGLVGLGGLVIGFSLDGGSVASAASEEAATINAWLQIAPDDTITILLGFSEMGQGVYTVLPMLIAEELEADWSKVQVEMAPANSVYANQIYKTQVTAGSTTVRASFLQLSQAGAKAREMLRQAAAERFGVPVDQCVAQNGEVLVQTTGQKASYGALAAAAAKLTPPNNVPLKQPGDRKLIGKSIPRLDTPAKVHGRAVFGIDVKVDQMLVGTVMACPVPGGKLKSVDKTAALAVKGVREVVPLDDAVIVLGDGYWPAHKGLQALKPDWDLGANASMNSVVRLDLSEQSLNDLRENGLPDDILQKITTLTGPEPHTQAEFLKIVEQKIGKEKTALYQELLLKHVNTATFSDVLHSGLKETGFIMYNQQDVDTAMASAVQTFEVVHEVPFLAHAPMEPMNATVSVQANGVDIWAPTQAQGNAQDQVAATLGLKREQVRVHTTFLGGGFGRRLNVDYILQAALASKAAGRPVKLIWSREEDTRHDFYRAAVVSRLRAGLDVNNALVAWDHRLAAPGYTPNWLPAEIIQQSGGKDHLAGFLAVQGAIEPVPGANPPRFRGLPYGIPNQRVEYVRKDFGVPLGFWRSVGPSYNIFFIETLLDEIARATNQDPVAFRLQMLSGKPQHQKVLKQAAAAANWDTSPPAGRFRGVALFDGFGSITAQIAEISVQGDKLRVHKVTCAVDLGTVINPNIARAQVEGAIVFGLTAALYGEITVDNGSVSQGNFDTYKLLTLGEMPEIEVQFIHSNAPIGGLGEVGAPPIAPAVANAILAATGKPVRKLPIRLEGA